MDEDEVARRANARIAEELEAFRYAVGHDLKFPLRVIDGFSRALEEDYAAKLDDEGRTFIASIRKGVGRMENMVARLDELLRLASAEMTIEELDITAIARKLVDKVRPQHAHAVTVDVADGLTARGDHKLVETLLLALIDNAFKFTGRTPDAAMSIGRDGDALVVRDNGSGFDSNAPRLFSPFRRMHAAEDFPGDGVGLAKAHRAVIRHGGQLRAESKPGAGAALFFTLSS
jgi:light-regulated signal transduction histidine kinase (bacteriophytochrome)